LSARGQTAKSGDFKRADRNFSVDPGMQSDFELREVFDRGTHASDGHGRQCDECVEGVFLELVGGAPSGFGRLP